MEGKRVFLSSKRLRPGAGPDRPIIPVLALALFVTSCGVLTGDVSDAQKEFNEGLGLFNQGRYEEAVPRFSKAAELDPNSGRAYLYLGRSYVYLKRWSEAISALRVAYRLLPEETKTAAFDILIDALFAASLQNSPPGSVGSGAER